VTGIEFVEEDTGVDRDTLRCSLIPFVGDSTIRAERKSAPTQHLVRAIGALDANLLERFQPEQTADSPTTLLHLVLGIQRAKGLHVFVSESDPVILNPETNNVLQCVGS